MTKARRVLPTYLPAALGAAAAVACAGYLPHAAERSAVAARDERAERLSDAVATTALSIADDRSRARALLASVAGDPEVATVALYAPDGRLRQGADRGRSAGQTLERSGALEETHGSIRLVQRADATGTFQLALSDLHIRAAVADATRQGLALGAAFLLFGIVASVVVSRGREPDEVDELARRERLADEANRAKSEFLAVMSHELRTPMNGVLGMTTLLGQTRLDPSQKRMVDQIARSSEHLLSLINDILDISKIEAGKLEIEDVEVDVWDVMEDAVDEFAQRARDKGIALHLLVHPDVPSTVRGDPLRLRQVLTNLIGNAVKFTERGSVTVRAAPAPDGRGVRLAVTDTGIGISAESVRLIFEPFQQADASTTRRFGGTGLGLSISRRLIERMGSAIEVHSDEGRGSEFAFVLPKGTERARESPLRGMRMLAHCEDAAMQESLGGACAHLGMVADFEPDGAEAVRRLVRAAESGRPYEVAAFDAELAQREELGERLSDALRRVEALGRTRLVALAELGGTNRRTLRLEWAEDTLSRPLGPRKLLRRLCTVLDLDPSEPERTSTSPVQAGNASQLVLVAEDNPTNQLVAVGYLERLGYSADVVETGRAAVRAVVEQPNRYAIVLMDAEMPDMDGLEATRKLRAWERELGRAALPIVAVTAHALADHERAAREAGVTGYLRKPLRLEDLARAMHKAIGRRSGELSTPLVDAADEGASPDGLLDEGTLANLRMLQGPRRPTFLRDILGTFEESCQRHLEVLYTSLQTADSEATRLAAHAMKGACRNVGAAQLARTLEELEAASDLERRQQLFVDVQRTLPLVRRALAEWVARES